jgi:hypothetical protein
VACCAQQTGNQVLLFQERRHFKPMANNTGNVKAEEEEEM